MLHAYSSSSIRRAVGRILVAMRALLLPPVAAVALIGGAGPAFAQSAEGTASFRRLPQGIRHWRRGRDRPADARRYHHHQLRPPGGAARPADPSVRRPLRRQLAANRSDSRRGCARRGNGNQDDLRRRPGLERDDTGGRADDEDRHGLARDAGAPKPVLQRLRGAGDAAGEHPRRIDVSGLHRTAGRDHGQAERAVDSEDRDRQTRHRRPHLRADFPESRRPARSHRLDRRDGAAAEVRGPGAVPDLRPRRPRVGRHARARRKPRWRSVGADARQRLQAGRNPQPAVGPASGRVRRALPGDRARRRVGPVDRDEIVSGVAVFGMLATPLADAGYYVLRYDKRGIGQSGGRAETATLEDLAEDVRAVVSVPPQAQGRGPGSHCAVRSQRGRVGRAAGRQSRRRSGWRDPGGRAVRNGRRTHPRAATVPAGQDEPARRRACHSHRPAEAHSGGGAGSGHLGRHPGPVEATGQHRRGSSPS